MNVGVVIMWKTNFRKIASPQHQGPSLFPPPDQRGLFPVWTNMNSRGDAIDAFSFVRLINAQCGLLC